MKKTSVTRNLVNGHSRKGLTLLLLQELKSRKLSILLHQLGVEECLWLPSLNEPIAQYLGLKTDEEFREFDIMVDKCVKEISDASDLKPTVINLMSRLSNIKPPDVRVHA